MLRRPFYTTFEIGEICGVNPTTVQNWVKSKKLRAFQTPGGHRRVSHEDLVFFLNEFGMPIPTDLIKELPLIMIVDDEIAVIEVLEELMVSGDEEVEVATAQGGVDALLMIGERKPQLLILDILMPGMNGFDVCKKLKSNPNTLNIKIVAITGNHNTGIGENIIAAGADLFFTKPLDFFDFREKCFKLLNS